VLWGGGTIYAAGDDDSKGYGAESSGNLEVHFFLIVQLLRDVALNLVHVLWE